MALLIDLMTLRTSPIDEETPFVEVFKAHPDCVGAARHALTSYAEALGATEEVVRDLAIAVSEACTNAVLHAYPEAEPAGGTFSVLAQPDGEERMRIQVRDHGIGLRPRPDSTGLGLGLPIMSTVADAFDLRSEPGRGATVTLTFRLRRD